MTGPSRRCERAPQRQSSTAPVQRQCSTSADCPRPLSRRLLRDPKLDITHGQPVKTVRSLPVLNLSSSKAPTRKVLLRRRRRRGQIWPKKSGENPSSERYFISASSPTSPMPRTRPNASQNWSYVWARPIFANFDNETGCNGESSNTSTDALVAFFGDGTMGPIDNRSVRTAHLTYIRVLASRHAVVILSQVSGPMS